MTEDQKKKLREAERILAVWLVDNTVDEFEESEIDSARSLIQEVLEEV